MGMMKEYEGSIRGTGWRALKCMRVLDDYDEDAGGILWRVPEAYD